MRKGQEWKSTESKWRKESLTFSDNETANAGTWIRNTDIHQSMAGRGGGGGQLPPGGLAGKAFRTAYVPVSGPEKSHIGRGLRLNPARVSRQCLLNRCSWQKAVASRERERDMSPRNAILNLKCFLPG